MNEQDRSLRARARREDCPVPEGFDARLSAALETLPERSGGAGRRRGVGRGILAAAAVCAVMAASALALSPSLRETVGALLGAFAPYAQNVEGVEAVDQGIRVKVVKALADEDGEEIYLEITDLTGDRLSGGSALGWEYDFRAYDPETRTGLVRLSTGYVGMETPTERTLRYDAIFPGGRVEFTDVSLPQQFGPCTARGLTEEELAANPEWVYVQDETVLVPDPGQTPAELGSELFTLSSMGFTGDGKFHVLLELADGLDGRLGQVDMLTLCRGEDRVGAGERPVQFTEDGRTYLDLRLDFQSSGTGPRDAQELSLGPVSGSLQTAEPIRGNWELTFPLERVAAVKQLCSVPLETGPATLERITLSLLGLKVDGRTPEGVNNMLKFSARLLLKDGTTVDLGERAGSWTWEDDGIATADTTNLEAYEADIHNGIGHFENRYSFDEPVDPERVAAVIVDGQTVWLPGAPD